MITKKQKKSILATSKKTVVTGDKFVKAINNMHELTKDYTPNEIVKIMETYPELKEVQSEMDKLHRRLVEIGIG